MVDKDKKTEEKKEVVKEKEIQETEIIEQEVVKEEDDLEDDDVVDFVEEEAPTNGPEKYYEATGRRKRAIARVRLYTKKTTDEIPEPRALITINDKPYTEYFVDPLHLDVIESPLKKLKSMTRFKATVKVSGGGLSGQADAIQVGLAKALVLFDTNFKKKMRKGGFLTTDSRQVERKKYGLKKARRASQWRKR